MSKPANVVCDPVTGVCRYVPDASETSSDAAPTPDVSPLADLLGATLKSKTGAVPVSSLSGPTKVLGIYFSAHWCGPCRNFTPRLAQFYTQFKESHARKDDLEIVFVSSDRDEASFESYFSEMPWLAVPYADRARKAALSKKFRVQGIPTLVFVNAATGETITSNGREKVMTDPKGEDFPWAPRPFSEVIAGDLVSADGTRVPASDALKGKVTLLYFSAHWCPPCRGFTPELVKTYNNLKADGKNVEAVFVSGDRSETQFKEYLATMPWLAIPFEKEKVRDELNSLFEVEGIPTLVVLDDAGKVITTKGRGAVGADPEGVEFPWKPKPLQSLSQAIGEVNDAPLLLLVGPGDVKPRATQLLQSVAEAHKASAQADDLNFAYGSTEEDVVKMVTNFAGVKLAAEGDTLFILNVPEQNKFEHDGTQLTTAGVADLVAKFLKGSLTTKPLGPQ